LMEQKLVFGKFFTKKMVIYTRSSNLIMENKTESEVFPMKTKIKKELEN
jgi:hypothetical protein